MMPLQHSYFWAMTFEGTVIGLATLFYLLMMFHSITDKDSKWTEKAEFMTIITALYAVFRLVWWWIFN